MYIQQYVYSHQQLHCFFHWKKITQFKYKRKLIDCRKNYANKCPNSNRLNNTSVRISPYVITCILRLTNLFTTLLSNLSMAGPPLTQCVQADIFYTFVAGEAGHSHTTFSETVTFLFLEKSLKRRYQVLDKSEEKKQSLYGLVELLRHRQHLISRKFLIRRRL